MKNTKQTNTEIGWNFTYDDWGTNTMSPLATPLGREKRGLGQMRTRGESSMVCGRPHLVHMKLRRI